MWLYCSGAENQTGKGAEGMTKDDIKDIRRNIQQDLEGLERLEDVEPWGRAEKQEAMTCLSEMGYYVERMKAYYKQYKGIMRD